MILVQRYGGHVESDFSRFEVDFWLTLCWQSKGNRNRFEAVETDICSVESAFDLGWRAAAFVPLLPGCHLHVKKFKRRPHSDLHFACSLPSYMLNLHLYAEAHPSQ